MLGEIALMTGPSGFEYIIVCCSNLAAENYWQKRLETTIKEVTGASGVVLCVHEGTKIWSPQKTEQRPLRTAA